MKIPSRYTKRLPKRRPTADLNIPKYGPIHSAISEGVLCHTGILFVGLFSWPTFNFLYLHQYQYSMEIYEIWTIL